MLKPGQAEEDVLTEARTKRMEFLERFINGFREQNAIAKASGREIQMPRMTHRNALKELKVLKSQLAEGDKELLLDTGYTPPERIEDVAAQELASFGITPSVAPLVPGLEGLSDIDV